MATGQEIDSVCLTKPQCEQIAKQLGLVVLCDTTTGSIWIFSNRLAQVLVLPRIDDLTWDHLDYCSNVPHGMDRSGLGLCKIQVAIAMLAADSPQLCPSPIAMFCAEILK